LKHHLVGNTRPQTCMLLTHAEVVSSFLVAALQFCTAQVARLRCWYESSTPQYPARRAHYGNRGFARAATVKLTALGQQIEPRQQTCGGGRRRGRAAGPRRQLAGGPGAAVAPVPARRRRAAEAVAPIAALHGCTTRGPDSCLFIIQYTWHPRIRPSGWSYLFAGVMWKYTFSV